MPLKGYKQTKQHKKNLSESHKGKPSGRLGSHHSEKTKILLRKINLGRKHTETSKGKMGKSSEKNSNWKGKNAGHAAIHSWVRRHRGNPKKCSNCRKKGKEIGRRRRWNIEWANKDHKYKRKLKDYIAFCQKCHAKYDIINKLKPYKTSYYFGDRKWYNPLKKLLYDKNKK